MESEDDQPNTNLRPTTSHQAPSSLHPSPNTATTVTRHLPVFSLRPFTSNILDAQHRRKAAHQRQRDADTAFWTTPGLRPLAEPPGVDWRWFKRHYTKSDLHHARLFPNDPEKRSRMKDLDGEQGALFEYWQWAEGLYNEWDGFRVHEANATGPLVGGRGAFYAGLVKELDDDYSEVVQEWQVLRDQATVLGRFEYDNLDEDLGIKSLIRKLEGGEVITDEEDPTVREAYGWVLDKYPLMDRKFAEFQTMYATETSGSATIEVFLEAGEVLWEESHPRVQATYASLLNKPGNTLLERFERRFVEDGDTSHLEESCLAEGWDCISEYGPDVMAKYGYLREKYALPLFEHKYCLHDEATREQWERWIRHKLWEGNDDEELKALFKLRDVQDKYLMPSKLAAFEWNNIPEDNPGLEFLEEQLKDGCYILYEDDPEVQAKYRTLFEKYPQLWRFEKTFTPNGAISKLAKWPSWKWKEVLEVFTDRAIIEKFGHLIDAAPKDAKDGPSEPTARSKTNKS